MTFKEKKVKPIFCFLDDSEFEINIFKKCLEPAMPEVELFYGKYLKDVENQFKGRLPALFIIDLYGSTETEKERKLPPLESLLQEIKEFPEIETVYVGLDKEKDPVNTFLRRLFGITKRWENLFTKISRMIGQSPLYGLQNLKQIKETYPFSATTGYTRKSSLGEAINFIDNGADYIMIKPQGKDDRDIQKNTMEQAQAIKRRFYKLVIDKYNTLLWKKRAGELTSSAEEEFIGEANLWIDSIKK